jgi:hypothetical protein
MIATQYIPIPLKIAEHTGGAVIGLLRSGKRSSFVDAVTLAQKLRHPLGVSGYDSFLIGVTGKLSPDVPVVP